MNQLKKILLIIGGMLSLGLGILGIILPLIPTTPLLLLAAACFIRSSDDLYEWLISNKYFGTYIENFRLGKGIPLKAKITGVTVLWLSMGYTILFVIPLLVIKLVLLFIGSFFTWFILKQKTLRKTEQTS